MKVFLSLISLLIIGASYLAFAEDASRPMTSIEKDDAARRFSMENPKAIGVFINLANPPEVPEEKILAGMVGAFAHNKIEANFKINQSENGDITTVTFFREGIPFTYPLGDSFAGFQHVTQGLGKQAE